MHKGKKEYLMYRLYTGDVVYAHSIELQLLYHGVKEVRAHI